MAYVNVDVYVDLFLFDDEELIQELENRGIKYVKTYNIQEEIENMYNNYSSGKPIDNELRQLFWKTLGRIV